LSGSHATLCCWSLLCCFLFFHVAMHCHFILLFFYKIYYPFDNIKILAVPLA
jgi:hypothetical protein